MARRAAPAPDPVVRAAALRAAYPPLTAAERRRLCKPRPLRGYYARARQALARYNRPYPRRRPPWAHARRRRPL